MIGMDSKESSRRESGMSPLKITLDKVLYKREQEVGRKLGVGGWGRAKSKKVLLFEDGKNNSTFACFWK